MSGIPSGQRLGTPSSPGSPRQKPAGTGVPSPRLDEKRLAEFGWTAQEVLDSGILLSDHSLADYLSGRKPDMQQFFKDYRGTENLSLCAQAAIAYPADTVMVDVGDASSLFTFQQFSAPYGLQIYEAGPSGDEELEPFQDDADLSLGLPAHGPEVGGAVIREQLSLGNVTAVTISLGIFQQVPDAFVDALADGFSQAKDLRKAAFKVDLGDVTPAAPFLRMPVRSPSSIARVELNFRAGATFTEDDVSAMQQLLGKQGLTLIEINGKGDAIHSILLGALENIRLDEEKTVFLKDATPFILLGCLLRRQAELSVVATVGWDMIENVGKSLVLCIKQQDGSLASLQLIPKNASLDDPIPEDYAKVNAEIRAAMKSTLTREVAALPLDQERDVDLPVREFVRSTGFALPGAIADPLLDGGYLGASDVEPFGKLTRSQAAAKETSLRSKVDGWTNRKLQSGTHAGRVADAVKDVFPQGVLVKSSDAAGGKPVSLVGSIFDVHHFVDSAGLPAAVADLGARKDARHVFLKVDELQPQEIESLLDAIGQLSAPQLVNIEFAQDISPACAAGLVAGLSRLAGRLPFVRLEGVELKYRGTFEDHAGPAFKSLAVLLENRKIEPALLLGLFRSMDIGFTPEVVKRLAAWQESRLEEVSPVIAQLPVR